MRCYIDRWEADTKNLKKEDCKMAERIIALAGFETEFELLKSKADNLQVEIENAKADAIAKIDLEFAEKSEKINNLLAQVSTVEIVEEEVAEEIVAENAPEEIF